MNAERDAEDSNSCCSPETSAGEPCPHCSNVGPIVGELPVRPHQDNAIAGPWQFCRTNQCDTAFYLAEQSVEANSLATQVGHKAIDKETPICFCFSHTVTAIADDAARHDGVSTIKADIKKAVASGACACAHLNPSGDCCLGAIHQILKGR